MVLGLCLVLPMGCSSEDDAPACFSNRDCTTDDPSQDVACRCDFDAGRQKCVVLAKPGEPCVYSDDCEFDGYCAVLSDGDHRCVTRGGIGAQCNDTTFFCRKDLYCDEGTCVAGYLNEGDECRADTQCFPGYICDHELSPDLSLGLCRLKFSPGATCYFNSYSCTAGFYCGSGRVCTPQLEDEAECSEDYACRSGDCFYGRCTRNPELNCK